jgi:hypothetical protein
MKILLIQPLRRLWPLARTRWLMFGAGLALALAATARAHAEPSAKRIQAVHVARSPVLDGKLDDPAWHEARFVSDFVQRQPRWGEPPSRDTDLAVVYDDEALYVGARLHAHGPEDIQAVMTRRDDTGTAECIIVSFDTFRDRRTAVTFAVTAAGVRADWYHASDVEFSRDYSFNPVWSAKTAVGPDGWTAEIRIPFTQMRFDGSVAQTWGVNINRYIPQRNEGIYWIVVPREEGGWSSHFGELGGLEAVKQPLRLEVVPYASSDVTTRSPSLAPAGDPFAEKTSLGGNAGVDAKLGLGPSLTLDMTVNPDFGQVEADPAEVNLTAYESFFAEQRPFFTEGSKLLAGQGLQYFYSRRIGASPRGRVVIAGDRDGDGMSDLDASYVDRPTATRILGAAKLTGRLSSGLSLGALTALTAPARLEYLARYDDGSEERGEALVEPLTSYNVLRLQHELGTAGSYVGTSLTGVARALGDDVLAQSLARQAVTGGVDWLLRLEGGAYQLDGHAGFSHLRGDPMAITNIGRSSVHYLQRPDQDHVSEDADATSLSGLAGRVGLGKLSGTWQWDVSSSFKTPGLDLNDAGLLQSADNIVWTGSLRHAQPEPDTLVHAWTKGVAGTGEWNFGGVRRYWQAVGFSDLVWNNFWRTVAEAKLTGPGYSDSATRGGPLAGLGWGGNGTLSTSNAAGSRTQWNGALDGAWFQTGQRGFGLRAGLTLQPGDRIRVSLTPRYVQIRDNRQYITAIADPALAGNPETQGVRYVFGTLDRRELAVQARAQLALTPELALDLYAEPFSSSGRFRDFGELPRPRSRGLDVYGSDLGMITRDGGADAYEVQVDGDTFTFGDPDFTALSFRSTAVLRWEFAAGSTLFVVWQANRADGLGEPEATTPLAWGDAIRSPGTHTVAVKLTYWWPAD